MGFSYTFVSTVITAHQHSAAAGEGGVLSLSATRIGSFSPMSLVIALG